jgi:predicted nucleic acid-binding protein
MIVVSNTSPLISLSSISLFDLLQTLFVAITIPEEVYQEIVLQGQNRPGANEVAAANWIVRRVVTDHKAVQHLIDVTRLGRGESEAIVLATELTADYLILDDLAARRYALEQNLPVIGTIGLLVAAKAKRMIPSVKQAMDELRRAGKYIHNNVYDEALRRSGE